MKQARCSRCKTRRVQSGAPRRKWGNAPSERISLRNTLSKLRTAIKTHHPFIAHFVLSQTQNRTQKQLTHNDLQCSFVENVFVATLKPRRIGERKDRSRQCKVLRVSSLLSDQAPSYCLKDLGLCPGLNVKLPSCFSMRLLLWKTVHTEIFSRCKFCFCEAWSV